MGFNYFSPDGGASEGGELFRYESRCDECEFRVHSDALTRHVPTNSILCPDCLADYLANDENNLMEEKFLDAIKERPIDELLSMQWVFDVFRTYHPIAQNDHTNIVLWENLVKIAIDSKKVKKTKA